MSDFSNVIRILVEAAALVFIPIGALAALAGVRVIWKKGSAIGGSAKELESLRLRIEEMERRGVTPGEVLAGDSRIAELEERLDFAERLLAQRNQLRSQQSLHDTPV